MMSGESETNKVIRYLFKKKSLSYLGLIQEIGEEELTVEFLKKAREKTFSVKEGNIKMSRKETKKEIDESIETSKSSSEYQSYYIGEKVDGGVSNNIKKNDSDEKCIENSKEMDKRKVINPKETPLKETKNEKMEKKKVGGKGKIEKTEETPLNELPKQEGKKEVVLKDESINNKVKPTGKSSVNSRSKVKKAGGSKKKVRPVKDQETSAMKQTSLTDHFPVRRSERKLSLLAENEARLALQKKILSCIEDGLEIRVIEDKGRGIFAATNFQKGQLVCEYAGDLVDIEEAKRREAEYEKTPDIGSYMYFFEYKNQRYCVDATKETSRLGRLLNHSKNRSNVHTKLFPIKDVPHLILLASRDIKVGEELLYDYGDHSKKSVENHPWLKD